MANGKRRVKAVVQAEKVTIDLKEIYRSDPKDLTPDITVTRYSNLAYVQASPRDVCVDFLEMPGFKKDGKSVVNGTRIYMSHVAAQKLGEVLQDVLRKAIRGGGIEKLTEGRRAQ